MKLQFYQSIIPKIFDKPALTLAEFRERAQHTFLLNKKESYRLAVDLHTLGFVTLTNRKIESLGHINRSDYFPIFTQPKVGVTIKGDVKSGKET